jgi:hypothetical protein
VVEHAPDTVRPAARRRGERHREPRDHGPAARRAPVSGGRGAARARSAHVVSTSGSVSSVFWCARCVQLNTSAARLAACSCLSAYTGGGGEARHACDPLRDPARALCGYAIPAALRAWFTCWPCQAARKTVESSAGPTSTKLRAGERRGGPRREARTGRARRGAWAW